MEQEDQLSNLPKIILHDILSRLPEEDAARTSVLSKAWAETWTTFPFLSFYDTKIIERKRKNFIESEDYLRMKRKKFLDYVERTLLRFHDQGLAIKQFKLSVNNLHDLSKDVDLWLNLASESGVEVLELCRSHSGREQCYILPTSVLEAKSLTKLVLNHRIEVDLAFMNRSMKFFSLQVLSLERVVLLGDEQAFKHLISRCPFIEYITLRWCYVDPGGGESRPYDSSDYLIKSLSMHDLPKLKGVDIQGIQDVYIDAPCLENLCYRPGGPAPFKMDFNRCRNLRRLSLHYLSSTIISNKWFLELFAKFPFLESLKLQNCSMCERINISSVQLKVLELSNCFIWKEVNINAPNLLSCVYVGYRPHAIPIISFSGCSSQLVVNVEIIVDYPDLCKLREFIQSFKNQTVLASVSVSLFIDQPIVDALNPVVLQVSSPPPSIKRLVLCAIPQNEAIYLPLVNRLLSSCCPTTISINLNPFRCSRAFIEFLYETLMGRNKDDCFCSSGDTKCWWHGLKGVKVTSSVNTDENVDLKTMLDVLQTTSSIEEYISFLLEF